MAEIQYILFDAVNTLIHKPDLWKKIDAVLKNNGHEIPIRKIKFHHKIISEVIKFPDRTSEKFYNNFNSEFLLSLGVLPNDKLLSAFYEACTYLAWAKFEDTNILEKIERKKGVLSNFNSTLNDIMTKLFPDIPFNNIIISENENSSKPSLDFYRKCLDRINITPSEILYIGDSIKLDMMPAEEIGFQTLLIDRDNNYPNYKNRIISLDEILLKL
jgi:putative hydrolase of the HAD superfamily